MLSSDIDFGLISQHPRVPTDSTPNTPLYPGDPSPVDVEAVPEKHRERKVNKEEELILELLCFLQEAGGKAPMAALLQELQWEENYAMVWGPASLFLQRCQLFSVANDVVTVVVHKDAPGSKRKSEKSRIRKSYTPSDHGKVACMCVADSLNIDELQKFYKRLDYSSLVSAGVLHVTNINVKGYGTAQQNVKVARFDLFAFPYGVVVWWGTDIRNFAFVETDFLKSTHLMHVVKDRYPQSAIDELFPVWCSYTVCPDSAPGEVSICETDRFLEALQRDHILLQSDRPMFKQSVSHAMAQSAKLDVIEPMVYELLQSCRPFPVQIRELGHANCDPKEVNILKGKMFLYHMMMKSDSELLDEPAFFWEHSQYLPLFLKVRAEYSVDERVSLLDQKLMAVNETLDMLGEQLTAETGSRVEWIIIWLLILEIVFALIELALEYIYGSSMLYGTT